MLISSSRELSQELVSVSKESYTKFVKPSEMITRKLILRSRMRMTLEKVSVAIPIVEVFMLASYP